MVCDEQGATYDCVEVANAFVKHFTMILGIAEY